MSFRSDTSDGGRAGSSKKSLFKVLTRKVSSGEVPPLKPESLGHSSSSISSSSGIPPRPPSPRSFFPKNKSTAPSPAAPQGSETPGRKSLFPKHNSVSADTNSSGRTSRRGSTGSDVKPSDSAGKSTGDVPSVAETHSVASVEASEDKGSKGAEGDASSKETEENTSAPDQWETIEPPEEFVCPLSLEIMFDPVIVSSGQTYERAFIARWIREGHTTCPKTRQPLDPTAVFPNQVLKVMINDWCKQNGVPPPTPRNPTESMSLASGDAGSIPQPLRRSRQAAESAARATAVAMESERRQRALLERMAAERGRPAAAANGQTRRQTSRRRANQQLVTGEGIAITSWTRSSSAAGRGLGGGDSFICLPQSGSVQAGGGEALEEGSTMNLSLGSFASDQPLAGWPGQLAMQATIFKRLLGPPSGIFDTDTESEADPGEASSSHQRTPSVGPPPRLMSRQSSTRSNTPRDAESGRYSGTFSFDGSEMGDGQSVTTGASELQMVDVEELVQSVTSGALEDQAAGAALLRVMTRHGFKHQKKVVAAGAVGPLIALMRASDPPTVEHATTTLMNLSLDERLKAKVGYEADIIKNMVHVLETGMPQARANAAGALFCISSLDGLRERIREEGAVPPLVKLLEEGDPRAKKDSANCLVSLCMSKENRRPISQSGAIAALCGLVREGVESVEEQTAAIFAALVRDPEGRTVLFEEGAIPALAELVEGGATSRCREYCVNALLGLAVNSKACLAAIDEEGISASIDVLTRTGNTKTQAKATALLELLRQFDNAGATE